MAVSNAALELLMTKIYDNAIASIKLGIFDYQLNEEARLISAVRNFYSGVLLLGKACLLEKAPKADPMEVLASKFDPIPDGNGGVKYEWIGQKTIGLLELKKRFKGFKITWPKGKVESLQKIRNDMEHYHSPEPKKAIQQAIAECFPIVQGFFYFLGKSPENDLGETWKVMLSEEKFFSQQKKDCDQSFEKIDWYNKLESTDSIACLNCGSSLICQEDSQNANPELIDGKCRGCGATYSAEKTIEIMLSAAFWAAGHIAAMEGSEGPIYNCPECDLDTYVQDGTFNVCFFCKYTDNGNCIR